MASHEAQPVSWRARLVRPTRRAICRTSSRQGMVMIRDGGSSANTRRPSSIARRGETESFSTMPREIASVVKKTGDRPWRSRPRSTARAFGFPVRCDTSTVMLSAIGQSRYAFAIDMHASTFITAAPIFDCVSGREDKALHDRDRRRSHVSLTCRSRRCFRYQARTDAPSGACAAGRSEACVSGRDVHCVSTEFEPFERSLSLGMDRYNPMRCERRKHPGFASDVHGAVKQAVLHTRHNGRNFAGFAWPQALDRKRPFQPGRDLWLDADLDQAFDAQRYAVHRNIA